MQPADSTRHGLDACARRFMIGRMARLSVNLNKVALLRNSRRTGVPDLLKFAGIAHAAGADGLTVHPRPDERHIRAADVPALAEMMRPWRPGFELNIEGYPDDRLIAIVRAVRPEQCTLVPDPPGAFTSEEGWTLGEADRAIVDPAIAALKALGCRVILFVDPDPAVVARVPSAPSSARWCPTRPAPSPRRRDGRSGTPTARSSIRRLER